MSSVAVFVFLLDNLAGFNNALNDTLLKSAKYSHSNVTPIIQHCDPFTTDQILSAVSQDLDLVIVPTFTNYDNTLSNELEDDSPEITNTLLDKMFDNSLREAENARDASFEGALNDNDISTFYRRSNDKGEHENTKKVVHEVKNETKTEFPKSSPFLVAIFETLSNITAQTCAGTLLSPRWVLTAANCVNILSNLYANNTNITHTSHYTIVAASTNPLLDGSAHNVTEILLPPDANSSRIHKSVEVDGSYLALMRIEPEVEGPMMELVADEVKSGGVMVYGWILSKNESEHESLNRTRMSGMIVSPAECQAMYTFRDNDVICLFNNNIDQNITQLSSGGPVLMVHDRRVKLLAVVQTDEHVFVSYPVAGHFDWINHTIHNK